MTHSLPAVPKKRSSSKLKIFVGIVVGFLIGAITTHVVLQNESVDSFNKIKQSFAVPSEWVVSTSNERLPEIFGTCAASVSDVRDCPSSFTKYSLPTKTNEQELSNLLTGQSFNDFEKTCTNNRGATAGRITLCSFTAVKDGYSFDLSYSVNSDLSKNETDPEVTISIEPS